MRFTHISGKRKIFTRLRRSGRVSRAELARECSLTRPAVSSIVDELIAAGYVREIGVGRSTGGKPPILLEFIPSARCAVGINGNVAFLLVGVGSEAVKPCEGLALVDLQTADILLVYHPRSALVA